jgi:hypothetical protein
MAITTWRYLYNQGNQRIPPGGTLPVTYGPDSRLYNGTIIATAYGLTGDVSGPERLKVDVTSQAGPGPGQRWILATVKNTGTTYCPYTEVFLTIINP